MFKFDTGLFFFLSFSICSICTNNSRYCEIIFLIIRFESYLLCIVVLWHSYVKGLHSNVPVNKQHYFQNIHAVQSFCFLKQACLSLASLYSWVLCFRKSFHSLLWLIKNTLTPIVKNNNKAVWHSSLCFSRSLLPRSFFNSQHCRFHADNHARLFVCTKYLSSCLTVCNRSLKCPVT